jgi:hypothetical protein
MLRALKWLAVLALVAGCGGGGDDDTSQAAKTPAPTDCQGHLGDVPASFKPLPGGMKYRTLSDKQIAELSGDVGDVLIANKAKIALGPTSNAVVTVQVLKEPLSSVQEEKNFMRGVGSTFGDDSPEPADLPGGDATVVEGKGQIAYVQLHDSCRVVTVVAEDHALARRVATAVLD